MHSDKTQKAPHGTDKAIKNSVQARMELPKHNTLDKECRWVCPEFQPISGIGEQDLWALNGLIVAIGFIDDQKQQVIGSGVMVAPGLCLTATHVLEGMTNQPFLYSFVNKSALRIWIVEDFHTQEFKVELVPFQALKSRFSDVCIISCSPFSSFADSQPIFFGQIQANIPKIGERLWTVGYREKSNDGVPTIGSFDSSGLVTELYYDGRGSHIKGPCVEVGMSVLGGMSGGAVFNSEGKIVGVITSGLDEGDNASGLTYVSLVWPALLSTVHAPWPENHWPNEAAGLQVVANNGSARVFGSGRWGDDGAIHIKFPEQSDESMISLLRKSNIITDSDADLSEISYKMFEEYLENEGVNHMKTLRKERLGTLIENSVPSEIGSLFKFVDVDCFEGMEDLDVRSMLKLEDGNLGVEATFNLRRVEISVSIQKADDDELRSKIEETKYFYDPETNNNEVIYRSCIRPYFRVTFTLNTTQQCCENIRILALSLPEERRHKTSRAKS